MERENDSTHEKLNDPRPSLLWRNDALRSSFCWYWDGTRSAVSTAGTRPTRLIGFVALRNGAEALLRAKAQPLPLCSAIFCRAGGMVKSDPFLTPLGLGTLATFSRASLVLDSVL